MSTKYYKILMPGRMPCHGGQGAYPPPGTPTPTVEVDPCKSGYHVCEEKDVRHWLKLDTEVWTVEGHGEGVRESNKTVFASVTLGECLGTLTRDVLVEYACRCAERVLRLVPVDCQLAGIWAIDAARRGDVEECHAAYTAADAAAAAVYVAARAAYAAAVYDADAARTAYAAARAAHAAVYAAALAADTDDAAAAAADYAAADYAAASPSILDVLKDFA